MRKSIVKEKLRRKEAVIGVALHLTDPSVYEMTSLAGFDYIWMDLEHHAYSVETASNLMRAARVGTSDIMARPAKGEFMRIGRLLESGAHGILYPRCDNADEAREVVRWSKFGPLGTRGFDGANGDMPYCSMDMAEYIAWPTTKAGLSSDQDQGAGACRRNRCCRGVDVVISAR